MPHFSRSKIKMRRDVRQNDMHGEPVEYRGIAFLQFRTEWNDTTRSFAPMTVEQKQICEDLYHQLAERRRAGHHHMERTPASKTSASSPKVMSFQLMVNKPDGARSAPAPAPAAPSPQPSGGSNGWCSHAA